MEMRASAFIHIVTWNSAESILSCIDKAAAQEGFVLGESLFIRVTDNASKDDTVSRVTTSLRPGITLVQNPDNLGFSGGQNQGVSEFLKSDCQAILILNPDVGLEPDCLLKMFHGFTRHPKVGLVTPKLLRALPSLEPIYPHVIDAAGMILTRACRHFDRGAGDWDRGQFDASAPVFGGTGACLLISRECVLDLCIPKTISDEDAHMIYPQLRAGWNERAQLFDEGFFAYREDADLSWRAKHRGWSCWYESSARGNHVRVVTPERRKSLPAALNHYSVRNRFLLQINNWRLRDGLLMFIWGLIVRNMIVIAGVVINEHGSLGALTGAYKLRKRAWRIRGYFSR
jgi:GT2 family glycosyltransferase